MRFDLQEYTFGELVIDGIFKIDSPFPEVTIRANNIWVRGGEFKIGTKEQPYTGKVNIILTGIKTSRSLLIDDISDIGTKSIAVTGLMEFYGTPPQTIWTRLAAIARRGDQ